MWIRNDFRKFYQKEKRGILSFHPEYNLKMFVRSVQSVSVNSAQIVRLFSKSVCGRAAAMQIFEAGLKRADPYTAVYNYLKDGKDSVDGVRVG